MTRIEHSDTSADVRSLLTGGDRRSIGHVDQVITLVEADPALFGQLIAAMTDSDPLVRMRGADAVEKLTLTHSAWLAPYATELLGPAASIQQQEVQWHLAELLPRLPLSAQDRQRAWEIMQRNFATSPSKIVRVFSLQAMFDLSAEDPNMRADVLDLCEAALNDPAPSMRSRARALLKRSSR